MAGRPLFGAGASPRPRFLVVMIATLVLAVGANTALFSLFNAIVLEHR
jgi:hypothetical protein